MTPGNANNAPPNPGPNYLATLDLNTGTLTPVAGVTAQAEGLAFVPRAGEGNDDEVSIKAAATNAHRGGSPLGRRR